MPYEERHDEKIERESEELAERYAEALFDLTGYVAPLNYGMWFVYHPPKKKEEEAE